MRKQLLIIASLFIAVIMAGCSNDEQVEKTDQADTTSNEESKKPSGEGPLIDPNNPHDERQELINMIDAQKELLKLGFATEDTTTSEISTYRYIENDVDEPRYQVNHREVYWAENSDYGVSFNPEPFICTEGLDIWSSELEEREAFSRNGIEGYYGHVEYGSSNIDLKHNDICYSASIKGDDDVYDEKDKRFMELLTKTIKTEEEGAYDPLYTRFTLDFNRIKLPYMNQDSTTVRHTSIKYIESKYDPSYSNLEVAYMVGDDMIALGITDKEDPTVGKDFMVELQTKNGAVVSKYEAVPSTHYFHWQDEGYTYMIDVVSDRRDITDEEILEIIDSTMTDERSFDNLDFFQGVQDKASVDENALELFEDYYY